MQTFLEEVAKSVYELHNDKLDKIAIVFPNRRPIHFFKSYLSEIAQKPIWSPDFFTIQDLFLDLSGFQLKDNISLLFELYENYIKHKKSNETFDDFLQWGEMLLNDFDDIDKFMVNAGDIFQNLSKQKEIEKQFLYLSESQIKAIREFWENFDPEPDSDEKKDFISVWEILAKVYDSFTSQLKAAKVGYEGLLFREVAGKISSSAEIELQHEKYIFIGFNALNVCEKKLFSWLKNIDRAEFFWDFDDYYVNNNIHQAGRFIRNNIKEYPSTQSVNSSHIKEKKKNITIYNSGTEIAQTLLTCDILKDWLKKNHIKNTNTAIVLSDESLLQPVLQEIPQEIKDVNITMGYPFALSQTHGFIKSVIELQNLYLARQSSGFYYKTVLELLSHPFTKLIDEKETKELQRYIETNNRFYIQADELSQFKNLIFLFKTSIKTSLDLSEYIIFCLKKVVDSFKEKESDKQNNLELEFIFQVNKQLNRLRSIFQEKKQEINIKSYTRLLLHVLKNLSVPFSGEPLKGLQIMGILESRSLDFENLIVLSLNEGILPKRNAANSYIPANLRFAFGLPLMDHQDSFFSYYFYRLIQRAKNIHLVYFSKSNGYQKGEKSRFIYQLEFDKTFNTTNKFVDLPVSVKTSSPIEVEKDEKVLEILNAYVVPAKKALSPSAINTYIDCSLKFYFKYIAKIKEPEEITEEIDPPTFGNVIHNTIDYIYNQFDKTLFSEADLDALLEDDELISGAIENVYKQEFLKTTKENIDFTGQDQIMLEVFNKYVRQIIELDKTYTPLEIVSLENEYQKELTIFPEGKETKISLAGKIDRIDSVDHTIRIIDYKTGHAETTFSTINSLFDCDNTKRNKAAFQTLLYCFLFENDTLHKTGSSLKPGLYPVRKLFDENFDYSLNYGEDRKKTKIEDFATVKELFLNEMTKKLEELFSKQTNFVQTNNSDICKTCPYSKICER